MVNFEPHTPDAPATRDTILPVTPPHSKVSSTTVHSSYTPGMLATKILLLDIVKIKLIGIHPNNFMPT